MPLYRQPTSKSELCRVILVTGFAGVLALAAIPASAAPITFNTALPVSEGHAVGREQVIYAEAERGDDDMTEVRAITVLGYGVTPDFAVITTVPWVSRDLELANGNEREASDIGDAQVFARYTAFQRDMSGGTFRVAPFVGVEFPTGENQKSDAIGRLPHGLQPGSGSLDVLGGVVFSWASLDWNFDGQVAYQVNRQADGINGGDVFQTDLAVYKRLLPSELTANTKGFLLGGVELNYRDEGRTRISGAPDANSGGGRLYITPGLQYALKRWMAEAAVQIPVTQDLNGTNFKQDFILRLGLRVNL